ncbi:ABC transporter ATP-binding protein [Dehalococcoidia bacterium]|nr:ABC transporter ATP-binding protein [Dehalococcoidia bacterium]
MTEPSEGVISVRGLVKNYGSIVAVDGISFVVKPGEVFGILGPNGAGKTTVLECIEGILEPTSGNIEVLGLDVLKEPNTVKDRIGVQLQASSYFDYLSVREILQLFGSFYTKQVAIEGVLQRVGLSEKSNVTVGKLSGGQQQRFAIAATLVNDPELIILDEPTVGLDPQARRGIWDFIRAIKKVGNTVVMTTHYMEEAAVLCDRVAIMSQGRIVAVDSPRSLVRSLPAPYEIRCKSDRELGMRALEALDATASALVDHDGTIVIRSSEAAQTLPPLFALATSEGALLRDLEVRPANLEDVFLALTGRDLKEGITL